MKKITKEKDQYGNNVIYVAKCNKYEYEDPEKPKKPISDLHNQRFAEIDDIIDMVEDY